MAHCQLYILAFLLATSMWKIQTSNGSFPLMLRWFFHCSSKQMVSPCRACERSCGQREDLDCAKKCRYGCICKTGWIRRNSVCIPTAQCEQSDL
ncbi:chymotrypsin-elastase inhibitor ixodidin [Drosophila erecta]|uniref:chymotrypsin-elastase inhibitor ixodidin n=1 Tax=Drosophila erecta TaxID=7220 RepID=UPI000F062943|nr:chymotrypsin-elastase inhibitor ixodidin [Drosophila erecta]